MKARGIGGLNDQQSATASLMPSPPTRVQDVPPLFTLWTAPGPGL